MLNPRRPRGPSVGAPQGNPAAPPEPLRIAAFGDSLMWGQGLPRDRTFVRQIAAGLGKLHKRKAAIAVDRSRSGAQIMPRATNRTDQREQFLDRFPTLFTNRPQRARFRSGEDEGPATKLYGEIPAAFPTIRWQIRAVDDALGKKIDVVLLNGGANDIDFEDVISPREFPGEFIEQFDGLIRAISHDDVLDLIRRARSKCPRAIIMLFGYGAPISYGSRQSQIRKFFKYEYGNDFGWAINKLSQNAFKDIERLILEARIRSVWAQGRAQHWMRQAVSDANANAAIRGPGVLFIPAGFNSSNSAFGNTPFLHQEYEHPVSDPVQKERVRRCPRQAHLDKMRSAALAVAVSSPANTPASVLKALKALQDVIDKEGPESLAKALAAYLKAASGRNRRELARTLNSEITRIHRAFIASFLHPNQAGANRFANNAVQRYSDHQNLVDDIEKGQNLGAAPAAPIGGPESTEDLLERFNLRGAGALLDDIGHLDVDSLSLIVVTARTSDANLAPDVSLVVKRRPLADGKPRDVEYRLNFPYDIRQNLPIVVIRKFYPHFEPAQTNRFTIDTMNELRLEDIVGFELHMGVDPLANNPLPHGTVWRPIRVNLEINGRPVFDRLFNNVQVGPMGNVDLGYPPAAPVLVAGSVVTGQTMRQ
ncbi:SGNH/GDSL hydrolase family protein [Rhizobium leguminosarum]|uniref:SGNH/GDSL hydrolase family protein n=1 Tax=Rhizobium leguminosarum TaxID=384 RepID=UPI00103DD494|nr:GDSL-type esterase/lipase family protein [Rhizobium leguminosarum]TBY81712.1 hypothetical protein E0H32_15625 [Rhizobium leguminosarum bv. viciae]